jgi:hypothetical protein
MDPGLTRKKLANHNGEGDAQSLKYLTIHRVST